VATFTFPGFKSGLLPDGKYRATLRASGIKSAAGAAMAGDHGFEFFVLTGDANRDGVVGRADFDILRANFRKTGRDFSQGDFNYDGKVAEPDFALLARNFGYSVLTNTSSLRGKPLAKLVNSLRDTLKSKSGKGENRDKDNEEDERDEKEGGKQDKAKKDKKKDNKSKSNKGKGRD
jgi:hypothetical protein